MFGYTIVEKIYIKRLKEELELLYDLNQTLDKESSELRLQARMADQAVDMQLGKIVHLEQLNRELTSKVEEVTAERDSIITSVAPEWDLDLNQPMAKTLREWLEIKEKHIEELTNTIAALTGENEELKLRLKVWEE